MITVYKFSAEWCNACKSYDPIFDKISEEFSKPEEIEFKKVDVEDNMDLVNKYSVKHLPLTLVEVNGKVRLKRVGAISENDLRDEINIAYSYLDKT